MNNEDFKKLLEKYYLSTEAVAIYLQVSKSTVDSWVNNKQPIPNNAVLDVQNICNRFDEALKAAINVTKQHPAEYIPLLVYCNEDDFFQFHEDAPNFRAVSMHSALIELIYNKLKNAGFNPVKVNFDPKQYTEWLLETGQTNSSMSRSHWTALQLPKLLQPSNQD